MLTEEQAHLIVHSSITAAGGKERDEVVSLPSGSNLEAAGIKKDMFGRFVMTIVSDPKVGVRRFEHRIDPNIIAGLGDEASIADLTDRILKLAAGKMCSNPSTPHSQKCCPYPATCPVCGAPVR
ncbi:hypothetical protein [Reyranella sp.]|uniref:hypothetical protein n=1 Tax=Reyranella sp. TaxID=1929291 RepID=UPI003D0CAFC6